MRQLVLTAPGHVELRQSEVPKPAPGAVLIKTSYCGICGTDLMDYRGTNVWGRDTYPKFPGHELSGIVEAVGDGVTHLKVGDRVVPECSIGCGICGHCKAGNYSLCKNRLSYSNGAMADYVSIPAKAVHRLPDNVTLLEGALIEPVAVGAAAALKCGNLFGKNVGVIGGGTIGLGALMTLHLLGAAKSFVFELRDDRVELALKLGATYGVNGMKEDGVAVVKDKTRGEGLDAVVVASAGTAKTVALAMDLVAAQGVICIVGLSGGQLAEVDPDLVADKELTIVGSHSSPGIWEKLINCVEGGRFDLKSLVSHVIPLEQGGQAFELLCNPTEATNKVVLHIN